VFAILFTADRLTQPANRFHQGRRTISAAGRIGIAVAAGKARSDAVAQQSDLVLVISRRQEFVGYRQSSTGNSILKTVTQLLRRCLNLEIHVDLHADEQRPSIGDVDKNIGDAKIGEIA
jgi:hypothetical protein